MSVLSCQHKQAADRIAMLYMCSIFGHMFGKVKPQTRDAKLQDIRNKTLTARTRAGEAKPPSRALPSAVASSMRAVCCVQSRLLLLLLLPVCLSRLLNSR